MTRRRRPVLRPVAARDGRDGYHLWCPGCRDLHGFSVPPWRLVSGGVRAPTVRASLLTRYHDGRTCHLFVTGGRLEFLGDCDHGLAGRKVAMIPVERWPEWARS